MNWRCKPIMHLDITGLGGTYCAENIAVRTRYSLMQYGYDYFGKENLLSFRLILISSPDPIMTTG